MSDRSRAALIGLLCLACCLPIVLGVAGATTGLAGALGAWLGRYEIVVISIIGVAVVATLAVRELRTPDSKDLNRKEEDSLT